MNATMIKALAFSCGATLVGVTANHRTASFVLTIGSFAPGVDELAVIRLISDSLQAQLPVGVGFEIVPPKPFAFAAVTWPPNTRPAVVQDVEVKVKIEIPHPFVGFKLGPKYPNECPCGINARGCDYHKDM